MARPQLRHQARQLLPSEQACILSLLPSVEESERRGKLEVYPREDQFLPELPEQFRLRFEEPGE